jgi:glycosyltransferase involved in cell wall biosynthesis
MSVRILVVTPAYNEVDNIGDVVHSVKRALPMVDVLVVDDGSRDDTALAARQAGALVVRLPYNLGIGGAVQTGYLFALEQGYDVAVRIDGDGQHDPLYIPVLLALLEENVCDFVIGSRFIGPSLFRSPLTRQLGIKWFARVISLLIGQTVTDPTSGFCAANRAVIECFARAYPQDYPEPEALVMLHRLALRSREVPVEMNVRQGGRSSITSWRSIYYMLKVTLAILMSAVRPIELQRSCI